MLGLCFFCKQKTAYEMRISDGSSDGCSSDLCPADVPEPIKARIRAEAEALDALRKQVLAAHDDLTLTGLYNVLEALKAGRALTDKERDVHDCGLVKLGRASCRERVCQFV